MARYALNFAITVWVDSDINKGEIYEEVTDNLTDKEWNVLVNDALNVMEIGAENLISIERIEGEGDD